MQNRKAIPSRVGPTQWRSWVQRSISEVTSSYGQWSLAAIDWKGIAMAASMRRLEKKDLDTPDETRTFPNGQVEVVRIDNVTVGRATFEPGWQWSKDVKPIAGTASCQAAHTGYQISGRLMVKMDDGTELEIGPGDAFLIPPGHDGWVVGDEPVVSIDFTGMMDYAKSK